MIVGLFLRNFKIYKNMNFIPFVTSEKDRMSIFAGDNGAGKSTILESIHCLMNNIDSKEWAYTVGQKKDSAHIFPLFLIKKSNWDDDDPQMARISHYFWEHHFNEMPANEVTKSFIKYRNKLKEWYHPSDYYLIAIGKDYEGNILLTTTFHNKISSATKKDGVSKDKIISIFKRILERYRYIYLPVENKISDVLSLQAQEMQGMMDKTVSDEIRQLLSSKDHSLPSKENPILKPGRPRKKPLKYSVIDLINQKLESYIESLNKKIPEGYKFEYKGAIKRPIKPTDILDSIFVKYFSLRPLSKNYKSINNLSSGEQRLALIDIATTLLSTKEEKEKEVILAIDEPEVSLESAHRFEQFCSLIELSEKYGRQIFVTTHWYGLVLRPIEGSLHFVCKSENLKIESFPLNNLQESRRAFPNSIEIRSYFDLMASMLTLLKKKSYNWIFCEGTEDYLYLKRYLENRVNNLYILPFNGCGNIKKIFDFLQVPFSDSQENKEIKGKVMCLIDTDDKNVIRIDGYKKSNYKNKLGFFRLSLNNDESGLISIASTMGINTEIEDLLDPAIFWDVLHKIKEQDEILHEFLSFYKLNEEMDFVNLSGGVAFLKPTSIEGYEKKEEFYEYLTSQRMKSLISNMYVKDLNNLRVRKCDKWLTDIIDFFENGDEQNIME
ncbi:AAA family ATPase [Enterobacter roggenkampii]|uniref:AAA family ATPase n=1 Tax=Enterobacter roggenkampii TaxID=1812935 RepID=UPI001FF275CF|nr:AAA family ATPase [Enterobacter roggenkampii]UOZ14185.1 ATP-binding protein [Enterobacter roggenkampii]